jgi:2-succinyl-5-enolpyruvyl-6-hydroxy-3-cyclohexene-1-carboxylate synthase
VPDDVPGAGRYWRSVGARAVAESVGPPAGPVHLNLPFREPLMPTGGPAVDAPGRSDGAPWVRSVVGRQVPEPHDVERLVRAVTGAERGLVVAGSGPGAGAATVGAFAEAAGWPVLADTVSGLRVGRSAVSTYDALLRVPPFAQAHRPDLVVRLGAAPSGRALSGWLDDSVPQVLVDPGGAWLDPQRAAQERVVADPGALLDAIARQLPRPEPSAWLDDWRRSEALARRAIDDLVDSWDEPFEGRVARDLVDCLPDGATLVVGSSMPVRDLESFARVRAGDGLRHVGNRGASGIDGFASTVLGVAAGAAGPVASLAGDLTLLHDLGGLLGAADRGLDATLVVLDNDGGGIFSFLPQAGMPEHFERLFGTPHGTDLVAVAAAFGLRARRVTRAIDVVPAVEEAITGGGVQLVVVPTDRADNVTRHAQVWDAVAGSLRP